MKIKKKLIFKEINQFSFINSEEKIHFSDHFIVYLLFIYLQQRKTPPEHNTIFFKFTQQMLRCSSSI